MDQTTLRTRGTGLALGAVLLFIAVLCNEWVLGFLFSLDADLAPASRATLRLLQFLTAGAGLGALAMRATLDKVIAAVFGRFPRLVGALASILVLVVFFGSLEAAFWAASTILARRANVEYDAPRFEAGKEAHASLHVRGTPIYDVRYRLDDDFHRVTLPSGEENQNVVLVYGGSFAFGEGVEDDETLPSVLADEARDWRVVNMGFPGHGTGQMLESLSDETGLHTLAEGELKVVYVFIPGHVRRAIGSMRVSSSWGSRFPNYVSETNGGLRLRGDFRSGRPWRSRLYRVASREVVLRFFDVDFPLRISDKHLAATARIVAAGRDRVMESSETSKFLVLIYPSHPKDEFSGMALAPYLEESGIRYLDYTQLLNGDGEDKYWLRYDLHPTALTHEIVGKRLAADLGLASGQGSAEAVE